jgi:hypothetical protein
MVRAAKMDAESGFLALLGMTKLAFGMTQASSLE